MTEEQNKLAEEIAEFQQRVYSLCEKFYPQVDGGGTDSGDWRDFTLAEIEQTLNHLADREPATEAVLGDEILTELDEAGAIGLDMSPGDPLARKAAGAIRLLIKRIAIVARERDAALKGKGASQEQNAASQGEHQSGLNAPAPAVAAPDEQKG